MSGKLYAELSFDGKTVRLDTGKAAGPCLCIASGGIEGWYSTPDAKVSMTEMQTGDGAHAVQESSILYGARTVTVNWAAFSIDRESALAGDLALLSTAHRLVRLRIVDGSSDTFVVGYAQVGADAAVASNGMTGTLTVVCPDPRRYSTEASRVQLLSGSAVSGGLSYGGGDGLAYQLTYGDDPESLQNVATIANSGTSTAYPAITVNGPMNGGFRIDWDGGSVAYSQPVRGVPLALDCLTRTASVGGLDTSRHLTSRGFPSIPPGGSITINLQASGTGWATVEWRDTYI